MVLVLVVVVVYDDDLNLSLQLSDGKIFGKKKIISFTKNICTYLIPKWKEENVFFQDKKVLKNKKKNE